ncbi:MAG TPA: choice-of-anchor D domain-containing protein [Streptosporangiaceae bacterium]
MLAIAMVIGALDVGALAAGPAAASSAARAAATAAAAPADEVTASANTLRDGWDASEPGLSPATLTSGSFGQLFSTPVNGQVYAQPVVAGPTVVVATQQDDVYGIDATSGAVKWSLSLGAPWPTATAKCSDVSPDTGVMSTPVYDPSTGTVYLVAEVVPPGSDAYHPEFYMHAIDAQTGAERPGWPVHIQGSPVNNPTRPFNAYAEWQRPALLLMGGSVYAAFASHCDYTPFTGYVVGVNTATAAQTMWTDESGVTDSMAGIWQSGGGLMSDGAGRIFLTSGNGVSPAQGPGSSPPPELADSVIRLAVGSGGTLSAQDFFSPANAPTLDANDRDLGSGGPVGLPFGSAALPHLLVQAGKDGRVFLVNRDSLGGREQGAGGTDLVVSQAGPYGGQWGHPAAFGDTPTVTAANAGSASDYLYYSGSGDVLRALRFGLNSAGTPVLGDVANSSGTFGFGSGSPVVTSNGTDPSSAVVWEVYSSGGSGSGGTLEAYRAVPAASCSTTAQCALPELWSAPIGTASKFSIPATDSGRVYVGTGDGHVLGFGAPDAAPLDGAAPASFGQVAAGSTSSPQPVTVTATTTVTVSGVSASAASGPGSFAAGPVTDGSGHAVSLPVTLSPGDQLTVPVTFSPSGPGGVTGALSFSTDSANFPAVSVSLSGTGVQPGFYAKPGSLSFGEVPDGTSTSASLVITNGGTTSETVSSVTAPGAPFSVTGLPSGTIAPGASVTATVTYQPTAVQDDSAQLVIDAGDGTSLSVGLSGTGIADLSQLSPAPASIDFGSVPLGTQVTQTIDLTNAGNLPATVSGVTAPAVPFGNPAPVAKGLPLNPGYDLKIPITFTPASIGPVTDAYKLTWTDILGTHSVAIQVTGSGSAPASGIAVPPPGGGWTLNGSAAMSGTSLALTPATSTYKAGSAVYSVPEPSDGLHATFTAQIGGGTGGNGMTMSLLDASQARNTALGGNGSQLGYGGLPGIAIALVTTKSSGEPSSNFIGIATGVSNKVPVFAATSTNIPALRSGTHSIGVTVSGQMVTVTVDGVQVLSPTLPAGTIPPSVLVAFTAGSGSLTDGHQVTQAAITAGGNPVPAPGGGWSYNGPAGMTGSDTYLTRPVQNEAGSVVYPVPVQTAGLQVQFNLQLSGGGKTGGYGMTFALLDPARESATAVGAPGPQLGFGGLAGTAATLISKYYSGYPSGNFAGISSGSNGTLLTFQTWVRNIAPLRSGTHTMRIQVTSGDVLIVWLDGQQLMQQPEPGLPATALLAFTAGTGTSTDNQVVRNIAIAATG